MYKKFIRLSILAASFLLLVPFSRASAQSSKSYNVIRICGQDRYETSAKIASQFEPGQVKNVILASGQNFPDALAGSVLSKKLNAPILLVDNSNGWYGYQITSYISKHLSKDGTIYLLGGESSISSNFVNWLKQLGYTNFKRLGGTDRFNTNDIIADEINVQSGTPVVIVNGFNFPDALSISSIAASKSYPIFISNQDSIQGSTLQKISSIKPSKIYVIGGEGALSNSIESQLKGNLSYLKDNDIVRISGSNRYDTSLKIDNYFKLDSKYAVLANGVNFPDALSGSALASKLNAPIILTDGQNADSQKDYIDSSNYNNIFILGGQGSVASTIENNFNGIKLDISGPFQGSKIVDLKTFDINNDGKLENIILACNKNNVTLYVQDSSSGNTIASKDIECVNDLPFNGNGEIMLADMDGDTIPEIISIIGCGMTSGSEACDIENMNGDTLTKLSNYTDGEKPGLEDGAMSKDNFSFELDGYDKFTMSSNNFGKSYSVDLSGDSQMQRAKINGRDVQAWMGHGPAYTLYDIDNSGVYGLKVYEDVSGSCHADSLGGFYAYYKYIDGKMELTNIDLNSIYPITEN